MCDKSWSMNCDHCISNSVKVGSGLSMSVRMVVLILRTPGSSEPSTARVRNDDTPEEEGACYYVFKSSLPGIVRHIQIK